LSKYGTIAIDSAGELARLFFSKDMGKDGKTMEKIRALNNYPGTTERLNMLVRSLKQKRDSGVEIVFTAHEDIEKIYARGSFADKNNEPVAVKGWPDLPGKRTPDEFCRAADNVLHVRRINGIPTWIARREAIGNGAEYWEVKDRFNGPAVNGGLLPANYTSVEELVKKLNPELWRPPYIWVLYGAFGIGKTRSLQTFPKPILLFDLDKGTKSLTKSEIAAAQMEIIDDIDVEESADYIKFITKLTGA
jgi:hypothetical protein